MAEETSAECARTPVLPPTNDASRSSSSSLSSSSPSAPKETDIYHRYKYNKNEWCEISSGSQRPRICVSRSQVREAGYEFAKHPQNPNWCEKLGSGPASAIYSVYARSDKTETASYAMKIVNFSSSHFKTHAEIPYCERFKLFLEELEAEHKIGKIAGDHGIGPKIYAMFTVDSFGLSSTNENTIIRGRAFCIVMDHAGTSLYHCMKMIADLPTCEQSISMGCFLRSPAAANSLIRCIDKMNKIGILHNDLHTGNVLLKLNSFGIYEWKIVDFGCAEFRNWTGGIGSSYIVYTADSARQVHCPMRDLLTIARSVKAIMYSQNAECVDYNLDEFFSDLATAYLNRFIVPFSGFVVCYDPKHQAMTEGHKKKAEYLSNIVTLSCEYMFDIGLIRPFSLTEAVCQVMYCSEFDKMHLRRHLEQPNHRGEWIPFKFRPPKRKIRPSIKGDDDMLEPSSKKIAT